MGRGRGLVATALGLGAGALVYFGLDGLIARRFASGRGRVLALWCAVAAICTLASAAGFGLADVTSGELRAAIDGFAAGALLVMLIDSMIPEAREQSGRVAGLVTTLGFAVAVALSSLE